MHLIYVLVIIVSILTVLSALALIFGGGRSRRSRSAWFLTAAIGAAVWGISISIFLSLSDDSANEVITPWLVKGIYAGAVVMDVALLGYISWKYKLGKLATIVFAIAGIILLSVFFYNPSVLYYAIDLSNSGNTLVINMNSGFYMAYALFFCIITFVFCSFLFYKIRHAKNKNTKKGYLYFMIGLSVAGFLSLIFDIILPPFRYDLIWVGPLTIGLVIIGFYYAILRFNMIVLKTGWLRVLSYVVVIGSAIIIYLLIFHLVFSAMFKANEPSYQVILLNFIMIAIVLLLAPAISEIRALTRSWIFTKQIDIAYIVKKITNFNRKKVNLKEIAGFLAEHMHFTYIGFLVDDKYYGSDDSKLPSAELTEVAKLKKPEKGIWQDIEKVKSQDETGLTRIGVLTNSQGEVIGQVVFGKPTSKTSLDRKDLTEVEMIINLMSVVIENGSRKS